jgi:hypothetical protein
MKKENIYKYKKAYIISNLRNLSISDDPKNPKGFFDLRIVSMIPGNRKVAGCFIFSVASYGFGGGVDALVILDMYDARETYPSIKKIVLIASDSDFVLVIERMKQKGYTIILYTYFDRIRGSKFSTSNHLLNVASKWVRLGEAEFEDNEPQIKKLNK